MYTSSLAINFKRQPVLVTGHTVMQISMPSLCYVDEEMEAVVVADTSRHSLHTISYRARVGDLHLPAHINTPHRAVQASDGSLFVLEYIPQRIVKLEAV